MKFRRKTSPTDSAAEESADGAAEPDTQAGEESAELAEGEIQLEVEAGPWDSEEIPEVVADLELADLGSLLIFPPQGREVRLQVDEASGTAVSVLIADPEGALELRAFAAPRHGDLWSEVLPELEADIAQRGGVSARRQGPWGEEVLCQLQVTMPDGEAGVQPSRIVGVNGPRWMLRATFLGRPAMAPEDSAEWETILASVVVRRGSTAMPKGEALPIIVPPPPPAEEPSIEA